MKSKLEIDLDKEFDKLGIKLRIFHYVEDVIPFHAISIVTQNKESWEDVRRTLDILFHRERIDRNIDVFILNPATRLLRTLRLMDIHGVSICDKRDYFNRQRGRIIAKGRLLKHLKKK